MQGADSNSVAGHREEAGDDSLLEQADRLVEGVEDVRHGAVAVDIAGWEQRSEHASFVYKELGEDKIFVIT